MEMFEYTNEIEETTVKIVVVGVGGAGGNALDTMIASRLRGVEFLALNTDAQALARCKSPNKVQLGTGLGAGSRPERGREAMQESIEKYAPFLEGADMIFITAGMGGGTGTGGSPIIAEKAREMNILTVGVVTKPFPFEGKQRMRLAEAGIVELKEYVDSLIVIPNQKLIGVAGKSMSFKNAFKMADDVLLHAVQGISDLITTPGMVNVDFADVRTIMQERGMAMMGIGFGKGEDRAVQAAEAAISSPLLDDISIEGAKGILINISGPEDMTMSEVNEACEHIYERADDDALVIFGTSFDSSADNEIHITVVATGFQNFDARGKGVRRIHDNLDIPTHVREGRNPLRESTQKPKPAIPSAPPASKNLTPVRSFHDEASDELNIPAFIRKRMN